MGDRRDKSERFPLHRRLTVRLGVLIVGALIALDVASIPVWNWLYYSLNPEWFTVFSLATSACAVLSSVNKHKKVAIFLSIVARR